MKTRSDNSGKSSIRQQYETHGAEAYYQQHAAAYENPHFLEIQRLIQQNQHRLDLSAVLDFAAGGGEVTKALQTAGTQNLTGCDPFTFDLYEKNTGCPCFRFSFKDVIKGALQGQQFSTIISSFALHLCPEKDLYPLFWNLLQSAPVLVFITPHKRPETDRLPSIQTLFEDHVLTERGKKVRLKAVVCQ